MGSVRGCLAETGVLVQAPRCPREAVLPRHPPGPWAPHPGDARAPTEAKSQAQCGDGACGGSASPPLCVRRSVCPSFQLSLCVCIFSSVLPSLSAPPLVSSSLTCWQDEVPRLPPGAHGPRSAPGSAGGLARCCLALRSSEQVDRHLLPLVALGVTAGHDSSPPRGESPPYTYGRPRAAGGQWSVAWVAAEAWPSLSPLWAARKFLCRGGSPSPHSGRGLRLFGSVSLSASVVCLSLSLLCPERSALLPVHFPSAAPTLGEGLLRGAGGFVREPGGAGSAP